VVPKIRSWVGVKRVLENPMLDTVFLGVASSRVALLDVDALGVDTLGATTGEATVDVDSRGAAARGLVTVGVDTSGAASTPQRRLVSDVLINSAYSPTRTRVRARYLIN